MKFPNVLQSGFEFTEDEHQLRLKYILFNCLIGSNVLLVSMAAILHFTTGNTLQGFVDITYVALATLIAILARHSKKFFPVLILCILFISLVSVALTYSFLSSDIAGISWFLIMILVAFYLTERKIAFTIFFISLFLVIYISAASEVKNYTIADIIYGILPLLITLIFVQFYETRNALSRKRLRILNKELINKVQHTTTELSASEDRFRNLVGNLSDWVWEMDKEGMYSYTSPSVQQILGYDPCEVEGSSHRDFLCQKAIAENQELFVDYIMKNRPFRDQVLRARHKDGYPVMLEVSGQPIVNSKGTFLGYRGVSRDISRRLSSEKTHAELKEQLHQAQKMEAIGTLAGGIAHDFNNILSAILGYAEITRMQLSENSNASENIDQVILAGKRATELVKQILTFSRKADQKKEPLRIDLIVKEALKMLRSSLPASIDIKTNIAPKSWQVLADPTNIHQIVVNLCTNAAQAIGNTKGLLEVSLNRVDLDSEQVADKPHVQAGSFVVLMVKDNGAGMDEETVARIFEPYFTTKKQEEGTGLGLAVIHGIVEDANGFIQVESRLGEGSSFHIYLPDVQEDTIVVSEAEENAPLPTGNERILIVDDEPDLTDVAEIHLTRLGYSVTTKTKSTEALDIFLASPDSFDLIITDQTMPDITGDKLARAMLKVKPALPIILYTGYTSALSEGEAYALGIKSFIKKPMSTEVLAGTVRRLLDE